MLLAVLVVRAGLLLAGFPPEPWIDVSLAGVVMLFAVSRPWIVRVSLIRVTVDDFREQIGTACRGLFLRCEEEQHGRFLFTAGGSTFNLRMYSIGRRLQLVVLPPVAGHGKVTLLVSWLSKQFPGPVPRVRIILKRR
jgi:hypothetical protein